MLFEFCNLLLKSRKFTNFKTYFVINLQRFKETVFRQQFFEKFTTQKIQKDSYSLSSNKKCILKIFQCFSKFKK